MGMQISRADLIEVARDSMVGYELTPDQVHGLMKTAETMDKVLLGGWLKGDCGCLVGTYLGRLPDRDDSDDYALDGLGMTFNRLLANMIINLDAVGEVEVVDEYTKETREG